MTSMFIVLHARMSQEFPAEVREALACPPTAEKQANWRVVAEAHCCAAAAVAARPCWMWVAPMPISWHERQSTAST